MNARESWYEGFSRLWIEKFNSEIKYILENKGFFRYDLGVFSQINDIYVEEIAQDYLDHIDSYSEGKVDSLVKRTIRKHKTHILDWMNSNYDWVCINNGWINLKTFELLPHSPAKRTLWKLNFSYLKPEDWKPTPCFDSMCEDNPKASTRVLSFVRQILKREHLKQSLIMVGITNSGKGTWTKMIDKVFKSVSSHVEWHQFLPKNIHEFMGKLVNFDKDISSAKFGPTSLSLWKKITGSDGEIRVKKLYQDTFEAGFEPFFFINCANTMPKLPKEDVRSIYMRCFFAEFTTQYNINPKFETELMKEIDTIFSKIIHMKFLDWVAPQTYNSKVIIAEAEESWEFWRSPLNLIVDQEYRGHVMQSFDKEMVYDNIKDILSSKGLPQKETEQTFKSIINKAMKNIGYELKKTRFEGQQIRKFKFSGLF